MTRAESVSLCKLSPSRDRSAWTDPCHMNHSAFHSLAGLRARRVRYQTSVCAFLMLLTAVADKGARLRSPKCVRAVVLKGGWLPAHKEVGHQYEAGLEGMGGNANKLFTDAFVLVWFSHQSFFVALCHLCCANKQPLPTPYPTPMGGPPPTLRDTARG